MNNFQNMSKAQLIEAYQKCKLVLDRLVENHKLKEKLIPIYNDNPYLTELEGYTFIYSKYPNKFQREIKIVLKSILPIKKTRDIDEFRLLRIKTTLENLIITDHS